MASLRTAFVQTFNFNNTSSNICNAVASFINFFSSPQDRQTTNTQNLSPKEKNSEYRLKPYTSTPTTNYFNESIRNLINLNINSLTKIQDNSSVDFMSQDQDDLVHVLSLLNDQQISLDDIQTVVSMKLNGQEQFDPQSTQNSSFQSEDLQNEYL